MELKLQTIAFKLNGKKIQIPISGTGIENLLVNMVSKLFFKKHRFEKHLSIILYVGIS
jgi:hypothetical protein